MQVLGIVIDGNLINELTLLYKDIISRLQVFFFSHLPFNFLYDLERRLQVAGT